MKHNILCGNRVTHQRQYQPAEIFLVCCNGHDKDRPPQARCMECYNTHKDGWKSINYIQVTYAEYLVHEVMGS